MTSSVVVLRRSTKALPKAKPTPKKGHGHCLVVCHPSDLLQLSESWQNHYIWEICSADWWDELKTAVPAAHIGQQNGPKSSPLQCLTTHHTTNASKLNELSCEVLSHLPYSPDLLPTNLSLLQASQQLFAWKTLRQPAGDRKWFPRVHQIPKHGFLCYRNKPTYLSLAKICWL